VILGITGNRSGLTDAQRVILRIEIGKAKEVHHGACVGADAAAHYVARQKGKRVVVHPPKKQEHMMDIDPNVTWLPALEYLERNHKIVDACDGLLAFPSGPERLRSGTWATVRYAKTVGKPVKICYPNGAVEQAGGREA
jgi:hypothetical protein